MTYLDQLDIRRQERAKQQETQVFAEILAELRAISAELRRKESQPPATETNTDLKDHTERIIKALSSLDRTTVELPGLEDVRTAVESLHNGQTDTLHDLIEAVKAIDVKPVVQVPAPRVTVQERPVDFQPLQETLSGLLSPTTIIDLSSYRAQDMKESGDIQYVGFVNPDGYWYIVENDMKKNQMRYLFGKSGYSKHFKSAASYVYKIMDKAIKDAA